MTCLLCLPVVVCNLGVEMLYVLEQRLRAQSVSDVKSVKVLHDVTGAMFAPEFVDEMFTPQAVYSQRATRQIFDKLAHASIMRLSEQSMDKLYDLMTMGFKYQLVQCVRPEDILNVTLLHLCTLKSYLTDQTVIDSVNAVETELRATYGQFTKHEWNSLRRDLFRFLGNKRVKVSLLLHEKLQLEDGRVRLPSSDNVDNVDSRHVLGPVGTVIRHDNSGPEHKRTSKITMSYDRKHQGAPTPEVTPGGNMYSRDRQAPHPPQPIQTLTGGRDQHGSPMNNPLERSTSKADKLMHSAKRTSFVEMNALAGLIRGTPEKSKSGDASDAFQLNLFAEETDSSGNAGSSNIGDMTVLEFRADSGTGNKASGLADVMNSFGIDEKSPAGKKNNENEFALSDEDDEDDLLALMDGA